MNKDVYSSHELKGIRTKLKERETKICLSQKLSQILTELSRAMPFEQSRFLAKSLRYHDQRHFRAMFMLL